MEYDSRKKLTTNIELFGLPGVGKSYCIDKIALKYNKKVIKIEKAFNFNKLKNIFTGLNKIGLYIPIIMLVKSKFNIGAIKLASVFLERIGRSYNNQNCIFDEGVMQALWGYFFRIGYDESLMKKIQKKYIYNLNQIIYISNSKNNHQCFLEKRKQEGFYFNDNSKYIQARDVMRKVICYIKNYNVIFYINKPSYKE